MRETFGDEVIDRTDNVWGFDSEGESRGCYRPSGQPGVSNADGDYISRTESCIFQLWFGAGDFWESRFCSKMLVGFMWKGCPVEIADGNSIGYPDQGKRTWSHPKII
jgi:hypothetical protein